MAGYPFPGGGQPTTRPCGGQERVSIEDGDLFQDFSGLQTKNCAAEMHQLRHICGARDFWKGKTVDEALRAWKWSVREGE